MEKERIIVRLTKEQRLNFHVPEWVFEMSRTRDVFIQDVATGELVQVLDLCDTKEEAKDAVHMMTRRVPK